MSPLDPLGAERFVHLPSPTRVVFGDGSVAQLGEEVRRLGLRRVLLVCSSSASVGVDPAVEALGSTLAELHPGAVMHVPVDAARAAVARATELGVDGCVAVGGGSAVGLAKMVARETGVAVLAVPTTYAGSEMTPVWGLTENGVKTTGRDAKVLPRTVVYDPLLTLSLPPALALTSGVNALAHAAEALYAPDGTPVVSLLGRAAAGALFGALPTITASPEDVGARGEALYGAWLAGSCLGATTMSLHHKLCHVLGGTFGLPHAEVHTVVLPHALAFNLPGAPAADAALREATGASDVPAAFADLVRTAGGPTSLRELGLRADGVERAVELVMASPYANPRPVTAEAVRMLLSDAFEGRRPGTQR